MDGGEGAALPLGCVGALGLWTYSQPGRPPARPNTDIALAGRNELVTARRIPVRPPLYFCCYGESSSIIYCTGAD